MKNYPLIVVGMHRSGTSAFTYGLKRLGFDIGKSLDSNYEDLYFQNLNKFVFSQLGIEWDNPFFVDQALKNEKLRNSIKNFLNKKTKKFQNKKKWCFKDPRTCILLDFWAETFKRAAFIFVTRENKDIAKSLINRNQLKLSNDMFNDNSLKIKLKQKFNIRMYPGVSFLSHDIKFATKLIKFYKNKLNKFYLKKKKKVIKIDYKDLMSENYVKKFNLN